MAELRSSDIFNEATELLAQGNKNFIFIIDGFCERYNGETVRDKTFARQARGKRKAAWGQRKRRYLPR